MINNEINWIGEIPKNWEFSKLKYLLSEKITDGPHETPNFIEDGVPFLSVDSIKNGEIDFNNCRYISEDDYNRFKLKCDPKKGDIFIGKAASIGKIAKVDVDFKFSIWSPLALIRPNKKIISEYLEYSLKSNIGQIQLDLLSTSNTQKNISMDDIPKLILPLPTIEIQEQISKFLNKKTEVIDKVIKNKKKLIKLLEEQKQAVIYGAVTKGLRKKDIMLDTNIFDRILDYNIDINSFPKDLNYYVTHLQYDEINEIKDSDRKQKLLDLFAKLNIKIIGTSSFVFGTSALGCAGLGSHPDCDQIKGDNKKHLEDALMLTTCNTNNILFVTEDTKAPIKRAAKLDYEILNLQGFLDKYTLKNSGIDWIGQTPNDWQLTRFKYSILEIFGGGTPNTANESFWDDEGIPWVTINDLNSSNDCINTTKRHISIKGREEKNLPIVKKGTVLYTMFASLGDCSILNIEAALNQAIIGITPNSKIKNKYMYYFFKMFKKDVLYFASLNTQYNLNLEKIKNFILPQPTIEEQNQIINYLDEKIGAINLEINKYKKQITLYKEYKEALIFEAITGKIKIGE